MSAEESALVKTVLNEWHRNRGAKMAAFGGFDMPIEYEGGTVHEHLTTRKHAGLFDVSHMGRFRVRGPGAQDYLQWVLTNNVAALDEPGMAQYTIIPNPDGTAVDDAYLLREDDGFMLVVNASNRPKDWKHLSREANGFDVELTDVSEELAMISLQGPASQAIMEEMLGYSTSRGILPENRKNRFATVNVCDVPVIAARTGYTGEHFGFELMVPSEKAPWLWRKILRDGDEHGVTPIGLGARDTLRLEAGLPLYGHELGIPDEVKAALRKDGAPELPVPIPLMALYSSVAGRVGTSFLGKPEFIGSDIINRQYEEIRGVLETGRNDIPEDQRMLKGLIWPIAVVNPNRDGPGRVPVRAGYEVHKDGEHVGWVTSGTIVPTWEFEGYGTQAVPTDTKLRRPIGLAYLRADVIPNDLGIEAEVARETSRGQATVPIQVVRSNMRASAPYSIAVTHPERPRQVSVDERPAWEGIEVLVRSAVENHQQRQAQGINLIPSENTPSTLVKLLSIMDPSNRYAEHRRNLADGRQAPDTLFYQGGDFIAGVEEQVQAFFMEHLGATEAEVRPISGQMANKAVFAGLVSYLNAYNRGEMERVGPVMTNNLNRGGHLSSQVAGGSGAMLHYVQRNPSTGLPDVIEVPVHEDAPYRADLERMAELIEDKRPRAIVLGKSLIIEPEPVAQVYDMIRGMGPDRPFLVCDDAHDLLLLGADGYADPLNDGADIVMGSTHKTFPGTQRGIIASRMSEGTEYAPLWAKIVGENFPGNMSNHHLGTLLGLRGATLEMQEYGDAYRTQIFENTRAFAQALRDEGFEVTGDPRAHQVLVGVSPRRAGPVAHALEANGIYTNAQVRPWQDGSFYGAQGIRLGTSEMTRFGFGPEEFGQTAEMMADVAFRGMVVLPDVVHIRSQHTEMKYCFSAEQTRELVGQLKEALRL